MDNLEEMDIVLEKFNLARLNQEETEIMNNPITSTEIESVIKKPQKTNHPRKPLTKPNQNMKRGGLCGRKWGHPDLDAGPRI